MRTDRDTLRHYHLTLTEPEYRAMTRALRAGPKRCLGVRMSTFARELERRLGGGEDDLLSLATSRLRAWYYGRVRDFADECLAEMLAGTIEDEDALARWLSDSIDGTDIVVYTFKAKAALLASDNEDAADELGLGTVTTEQRASCALEADVRELLESYARSGSDGEGQALPEGFDLSDPETWTAVHCSLPRGGSACGASGRSEPDVNDVTCPACLRTADADEVAP